MVSESPVPVDMNLFRQLHFGSIQTVVLGTGNAELKSTGFFRSSSSVAQLCSTLCNPADCSTPGFPVLHHLLEPAQTHVHCVSDAIQPSHPLSPRCSSCLHSFPASGSFPMSQLFESGGQSIGASASASILSMNIQD